VAGITFRNVAHLGRIVATLDVLSGGRAVCGLGTAWFEDEHRAYGWPFPPRTERYDLLADALELLPLLWGPGAPAFTGRRITVPEASCYPRPLQERVPILVGGSGERRTLRLVAERADGCNLFGDPATVRRKLEVLARHCAAVGRDPACIEVTHLSTRLTGPTPDDVADLVARLRPGRTPPSRYAASAGAGTVSEQVRRFEALRDAGVGTAIVRLADLGRDDGAIERFAPVVAALRGVGPLTRAGRRSPYRPVDRVITISRREARSRRRQPDVPGPHVRGPRGPARARRGAVRGRPAALPRRWGDHGCGRCSSRPLHGARLPARRRRGGRVPAGAAGGEGVHVLGRRARVTPVTVVMPVGGATARW
jgi:alkanesulfonate monooxygenase SsuD/methylene tetrahydromethanopterin reductase-like flavin-dependent oxidoreductase (luciferase family)